MSGAIVVIPARGLRTGKTRLAGNLPLEAREALIRRMMRGVIEAARASGLVETIAVISPDPEALEFAREVDGRVVPLAQEPARPGLNAAVTAGRDWALTAGGTTFLILFGDLPLITAHDVRGLVMEETPVVLAPDRHGVGTNALRLRLTEPASADFRFQFGRDSLHRHRVEAERLALGVVSRSAPGTAFDLDTADDLRALLDAESWESEHEEAADTPLLLPAFRHPADLNDEEREAS
ncbi:MAG: 2-phospho-L-lactate guanylyltransferase [Chloroflexia bacterium]|nr:2-phospho-L-lactate guanylyltransferase [Chloroflexia bacterium]